MPGSHVTTQAGVSRRNIEAFETPVTPYTLCAVDCRIYNRLLLCQRLRGIQAIHIVIGQISFLNLQRIRFRQR